MLTLDTYASHQGVIYCKPHHKELFMPKAVEKDTMEEIMRKKKNVDFDVYKNGRFLFYFPLSAYQNVMLSALLGNGM